MLGVPFYNSVFEGLFYWFWVPSGTSFSIKNLEKQSFGTTCGGHEKRVWKICDFWVTGTTKSEPPCRREHDLEVLSNSRKMLHFGGVLVPPFGAFGVSYHRKHCFQGCWIFVRSLHKLLHNFRPPKRSPKSKVFGSVFRYPKVQDFYIITLLIISFL